MDIPLELHKDLAAASVWRAYDTVGTTGADQWDIRKRYVSYEFPIDLMTTINGLMLNEGLTHNPYHKFS